MKTRALSWKHPLVSVITPSYNQGQFIEDTILSVKNQDYPNIEHIVVDGASTDDTLEVLEKYQDTYGLRWVSEPDRGHSDGVNKGFRMAQGEIVGWLNSDDAYLDVLTVSAVVEVFQNRPDADIVYGDIVFISEDDTVLMVRCVPRLFGYRRLLLGCFLEQPAVFLRREVVRKHELDVSIHYAIDYEYWLRIGQQYRFLHLDRILAADRNHANRRMVTGIKELQEVSMRAQSQHGQVHNFSFHLLRLADRVLTGVPRRLKGAWKLLSLYHKTDFAFCVKMGPVLDSLKRQLMTRSYLELLRG
jgi:glycosyltransferase involved in cell wall biosynthesis